MPIIRPIRRVPDDEREDIDLPLDISQLPTTNVGMQVWKQVARFRHYGVKDIRAARTLPALEAKRLAHNAVIGRAWSQVERRRRTPGLAPRGVVVGEYRFSTWPPYPHIQFDEPRPHKHVVVASIVNYQLKYWIKNETLDGIPLRPMVYTPSQVREEDIQPLRKFCWGMQPNSLLAGGFGRLSEPLIRAELANGTYRYN